MSSTGTLEIKTMAQASTETVFFKCPFGGFASLSPGVCPKCGEHLMKVGAPPVLTDNYVEGHAQAVPYNFGV